MAKPKPNMNAVADVAEVMQFENWLRFYFVREQDGELVLTVPDQAQEKIQQEYPHLAPLLKHVNDKPVTYENSVSTVCSYVSATFDGKKYPAGTVERVFESDEFNLEMQMFAAWAQGHEAQLDQTFLDFAKWRELYDEWKNSPEVQEHLANVKARTAPLNCSTPTQ